MHLFDDAQDALDAWDTDETQWILVETMTDQPRYAVGPEMDALHVLMTSGWEMTSPEEVTRAIAKAWAADEEADRAYQDMLDDAERYAEMAADDAAAEAAFVDTDETAEADTDLF